MKCDLPDQPESMCWNCRFFATSIAMDRFQPPEQESQEGECRRHPPVTDHGQRDTDVNYAVFPIVFADDWCGEFAPRMRWQDRKDRAYTSRESKLDNDAQVQKIAAKTPNRVS